ncbi:hypothetical protein MG293_000914 [Ovis ammon polii]|uniref:Uncharacterized protein n=1 Tax=Ovis ammon polii TaxID=230172 RepID=A0AAD4UQS0_OVIAM|nr:hypothetical protein MG293_000914 [Ovis ammon polii]
MVNNPLAMQETRVQSLGLEDLLEKEMASQSSILAWRIPWTEEPASKESTCKVGDLDSIPGLGRSPGETEGYPFQYSGLENSMEEVHGVAKSRTQLSNFQRSRCSRRSQRQTGDDGGQEDTASEGTQTRRFAGLPQAAPGIFVLVFLPFFPLLPFRPVPVESRRPPNKKGSRFRTWEPRCRRVGSSKEPGGKHAPVARMVRGTFLTFLGAPILVVFGFSPLF